MNQIIQYFKKSHPKPSIAFIVFCFTLMPQNKIWAQLPNIVLGRPTDTSITASIMYSQATVYYLQYGTTAGNYTKNTSTFSAAANVPDEININNLTPNTRYYYRIQFHSTSGGNFAPTP